MTGYTPIIFDLSADAKAAILVGAYAWGALGIALADRPGRTASRLRSLWAFVVGVGSGTLLLGLLPT